MTLKQPIDTTKEMKFYVSWVFPAGALIFSLIFGFGSVSFLLAYDYSSLHFDLVIGMLVLFACSVGLIWSVSIALFHSVLLMIDGRGISIPNKEIFLWSSVKEMELVKHPALLSSETEPPFLRIIFLNGVSYDLSMILFSVSGYKLLEILRTYHGSLPGDSQVTIEYAARF